MPIIMRTLLLTIILALASVVLVAQAPDQRGRGRKRAAARTVPMRVVDSAHLRTGVALNVRMRPMQPIEEGQNAVSAPLAGAVIVVENAEGLVLGRVQSDTAGRCFLELREGTHYFRPQPFRGRMFPHPLESKRVYVTKGQVVEVSIEYDTGIR